MEIGKMYINGEWVLADSGKTRNIINPATREIVGIVADGGLAETRRAILAAHNAFDEDSPWRAMNHMQRAALLNKTAALFEARADEIAALESKYTGKLLKVTRGDVAAVVMVFRYYAGIVGTPSGQTFNTMREVTTLNIREPIGVCGLIVPWNSPISIGAKCIAPALAAGNTIVVKPASITPLSTIIMFECMEQAGFPKGSVNLVLGEGSVVGNELGENKLVGKVSLTGGTETGKNLIRASANNVKKLSLELGGKSPLLVFDDGDLECAVDNAMYGLFNNAGQVCIAPSRILVQEGVYEEFCSLLVEKVRKIRVGKEADPNAEMGPVISEVQMEKILRHIDCGIQDGARLACGGKRLTDGEFAKGFFVEPTVFVDCTNDMRIAQEEIFGPVMVVEKFSTEKEAFRIANDTIYGLGAAIYTKDVGRTWRFVKSVKAACLWVNAYFASAALDAPISCLKQSGYSTLMGTACIESYMDIKQISVKNSPTKFGWFKG